MAKRKKRRAGHAARSGAGDVIALPGDRKAEIIREGDPDGRPVAHPRTIDTLGRMRRSGTITPSMYDAARDFQAEFTIAALDTVHCMPLERISGGGRPAEFTDRQLAARDNLDRALDALGGIGSPAGSCVWFVVGLQHSLREWAMRQGWSGRRVHTSQAPGILVAALGMLAAHYGYEPSHQKLGA